MRKSNLLTVKMAFLLQLLNGCGQVESKTTEPETGATNIKEAKDQTIKSLYVQNASELPTCNATQKNALGYVAADGKFFTCDGGAWAAVSIKGEKGDKGDKGENGSKGDIGATGATGANGTNGKDGTNGLNNKITATLFCSGNFTSLGGVDFSSLKVTYWSSTTAAGDTWAYAEIYGNLTTYGNSRFYAANQNGATSAAVNFVYDVYSTANGGYWNISVNRSNAVATVVYTDSDLPTTGTRQWTFPPCTVQNY